jgi:hypothetical protein
MKISENEWVVGIMTIAKVVALIAVTFASIELGLLLRTNNGQAASTLTKLGAVLDTTDKTMLLTNKAVNDLRLTLDNVNKAAIDERNYSEVQLPPMTKKVNSILDSVQVSAASTNQLVAAGTNTLIQADKSIAGIQPLEAQLTDTVRTSTDTVAAATTALQSANKTILDADNLVASPSVVDALHNIDISTANIATSTKTADDILIDAKVEERKFVYPAPQPWYKKIWHATFQAGELAYDFIR